MERHASSLEMFVHTRGEGEPWLLLHGLTGSGADWDLVFENPPAGCQLIAPDLRGHGRTTNPSGELSFRQMARDVAELLDRLGIERCKAVGLSGGGQALLHLALAQPERVEAMVLASTAPYFPAEARALMAQVPVDDAPETAWAEMRARHPGGDEQIRALWRFSRGLQHSVDDVCFTPPHLATVQAPTLVVHGDRDPLYPVGLAVSMFEALPEAQLWVVPGGGHCPIFGPEAARFVDRVEAFLGTPKAAS